MEELRDKVLPLLLLVVAPLTCPTDVAAAAALPVMYILLLLFCGGGKDARLSIMLLLCDCIGVDCCLIGVE
jgi:hypothetical protein